MKNRLLSKLTGKGQTALSEPQTGQKPDLNGLCRKIRQLDARIKEIELLLGNIRRDMNRIDRKVYREQEPLINREAKVQEELAVQAKLNHDSEHGDPWNW